MITRRNELAPTKENVGYSIPTLWMSGGMTIVYVCQRYGPYSRDNRCSARIAAVRIVCGCAIASFATATRTVTGRGARALPVTTS